MHNTPELLQQKFKIEPEKGRGRPVARVLFAYQGTGNGDKRRFLTTTIAMTVHGSLPSDGRRRSHVQQISQEFLGASAGIRRETMTRRISRLAPAVDSARRKLPADTLELIARNRQFAEPNIYGWNREKMPERKVRYQVVRRSDGKAISTKMARADAVQEVEQANQRVRRDDYVLRESEVGKDDYHAPELPQLVKANPALWDGACEFANGFKEVHEWIWDQRLMDPDDPTAPLGEIPRLVMSYYVMKGLTEDKPTTHPRGEISPPQPEVADRCGISVKSVYLANKKWERMGLLRVVQDRIPGEKWKSRPAAIIYLPFRKFSQNEAAEERDRFKRALEERLETARIVAGNPHLQPPAWMGTACAVHRDVLGRTEGKEIARKTFYRMLSAALLHAGLKRDLVRSLVPLART